MYKSKLWHKAKSSRTARLLCFGLMLIMVFACVFGMSGCQSIQEHKANAKVELDAYTNKLSGSFDEESQGENYITGLKIENILYDGKAAIDNASSKRAVNKALKNAKTEFDSIPIVFPMSVSAMTSDGETGSLGCQFFFYLKMFEENIIYECVAGVGTIDSFPRPDEPLPSIYEGFYGRQPQIVRWFVGFEILCERDFIDFIIKIDEDIIGYIVVEMSYNGASYYTPNLLASVVSPKTKGKYQAINEEEVKAAIEDAKENCKTK